MKEKYLSKIFWVKTVVVFSSFFVILLFALVLSFNTNMSKASADEINPYDYSWILDGNGGRVEFDKTEIKGGWHKWQNAWDFVPSEIKNEIIFAAVTASSSTPKSNDKGSQYLTFLLMEDSIISHTLDVYMDDCETTDKWMCNQIWKNIYLDVFYFPRDNKSYNFVAPKGLGNKFSVFGNVTDDRWEPIPGAIVQYYQLTPYGEIPVLGMATLTDYFGNFALKSIKDESLPGVIKVYKNGYKNGESWSIWTIPVGESSVYRYIQMKPEVQPDPPVPPTPPDPPIPPEPVPPTPVPPIPVEPGIDIPQTGDSASLACAIFAIMALLSAGVFTGRRLAVK